MSPAVRDREDHPMLRYERALAERGAAYIAGIDEAGRGALAGPVVAAAVVLPPGTFIEGLNDSKQLSPTDRREFFAVILDTALAVGVGAADREVIDALNIYRATQLAMASAVSNLPLDPDALLIDAMRIPQLLHIRQESVIKGDRLSQSIAAASVIAKVTRDDVMRHFHDRYPRYGFDRHKGYATRDHLNSIEEFGPCALHRVTFRGVKEHFPSDRREREQIPMAFRRD